MSRVVACGGREFENAHVIEHVLGKLNVTALAHGGASGADALCAAWAALHSIPLQSFPAQWDKHGKAAGPIRNAEMLRDFKPDVVVAFAGGRGTDDTVSRAKRAGVRTVHVKQGDGIVTDDRSVVFSHEHHVKAYLRSRAIAIAKVAKAGYSQWVPYLVVPIGSFLGRPWCAWVYHWDDVPSLETDEYKARAITDIP